MTLSPSLRIATASSALMLLLSGCSKGGGGDTSNPSVQLGDAAVVEVSPYFGESGVSLKREATLVLSGTVQRSTVNQAAISIWHGDQRVEALPYLHAERNRISVFTESFWPSGAFLELRIEDGKILSDNGRPIDADGNGLVGGGLRVPFRVVDTARVPNTEVCGRVFASELDGSGRDVPLAGVKVVVDGIEQECYASPDAIGTSGSPADSSACLARSIRFCLTSPPLIFPIRHE